MNQLDPRESHTPTMLRLDIFPGDTFAKGKETFYVESVTDLAIVRLVPVDHSETRPVSIFAAEIGAYRLMRKNWKSRIQRNCAIPTTEVTN